VWERSSLQATELAFHRGGRSMGRGSAAIMFARRRLWVRAAASKKSAVMYRHRGARRSNSQLAPKKNALSGPGLKMVGAACAFHEAQRPPGPLRSLRATSPSDASGFGRVGIMPTASRAPGERSAYTSCRDSGAVRLRAPSVPRLPASAYSPSFSRATGTPLLLPLSRKFKFLRLGEQPP
jgi:hypothetical protein